MDIGGRVERLVEAARATVLPIHPLQIDVLKLIACVCMLIDHINTCLYDRASVWAWLIGRLAFPLFGLTFVLTLTPESALRVAKRTALAGILVQPIYALAFSHTGFSPWWAGNILFSFAAAAYVIKLVNSPTWPSIVGAVLVMALTSVTQAPSSFGLAGIVFMLMMWFLLRHITTPLPASVLTAVLLGLDLGTALVPALMSMALALLIRLSIGLRSLPPRRLLRARSTLLFYAAHLLVIAVLLPIRYPIHCDELIDCLLSPIIHFESG